jgi:uncharacterized protein YicC (UPF0701 family)
MTQLEQLRDALNARDLLRVQLVLSVAQNEPPHGQSDGSIPESIWTAARKLIDALGVVREAEGELRRRLVVHGQRVTRG